jgi:hypothetical protein
MISTNRRAVPYWHQNLCCNRSTHLLSNPEQHSDTLQAGQACHSPCFIKLGLLARKKARQFFNRRAFFIDADSMAWQSSA